MSLGFNFEKVILVLYDGLKRNKKSFAITRLTGRRKQCVKLLKNINHKICNYEERRSIFKFLSGLRTISCSLVLVLNLEKINGGKQQVENFKINITQ